MADTHEVDERDGSEIAIIGMAVRVPGADDVDTYWSNLRDGVESVRRFTDEELDEAGVAESVRRTPGFVPAGGPLDSAKDFDPTLFGLSPRDASIMDPQHRHFVEASWEALEHAGYDPSRFEGAIGVYAGSGHNAYMPLNLMSNPSLVDSVGFFLLRHTSNDKDFMATRVSYLFDLKGPAINVQTACSTSLVATHLGVQSLLNGESDMVLAGGATIEMPLNQGYIHKEGEILSADGHCRAFDADSSGTVFGSGAGVVVLKRLDDAIDDGDTIHAIIRSSAINNDGSGKVGYLAPSVDGQAAAVGEAIALADVDPETIGFVECHGTGTEIGDPIEIAALTEAFRAHTAETGFCAVGSVKTNIGHLDTAAGVASLVKASLAVKHGEVPPTLHYQAPNPRIDFESSPFFVNNERIDWPVSGAPRRAGVSSLGVGGTNAHIIVEEPPQPSETDAVDGWQVLPLSAKGPTALDEMAANLARHLKTDSGVDLADVAFTLQEGRQALDMRRFAVVRDRLDAIEVLEGSDPQRLLNGTTAPKERPIVFMFPGQGAQYPDMGRGLYDDHAVFRDVVDECAAVLDPILGFDLRTVLFPAADDRGAAAERLAQTAVTQPAIFTIEYAMARLLMSWGIEPTALIGHSIGEYTAACLSGVFSLASALRLVATRGKLMQELPPGSMMAIPQPAAAVEPLLGEELSLAARNGPEFSVVAGPDHAVDALQAILEADEVAVSRLRTSHAFHSAMMDPMLAAFREAVAATDRSAPSIPFVSNVTGTWITPEQCGDPDYWAQHVRGAVDFVGGLQTILEIDAETALVEVGPGRTLATFAKQLGGPHGAAVTTSIRHPNADVDDTVTALAAVGHLWAVGAVDDWAAVRPDGRRRRIPLPTYPFQHDSYWVEPGTQVFDGLEERSLAKRPDITDWFHVPAWRRTASPSAGAEQAGTTLVFLDEFGIGERVLDELAPAGPVVSVRQGEVFDVVGGTAFTIDPGDPDHYRRLFADLGDRDDVARILYLWTVGEAADLVPGSPSMTSAQTSAFTAPLLLAQSLGLELTEPLDWWVVTNRMRTVAGDTVVHPEQALSAGAIQVIAHENPLISARSVDIEWPGVTQRRLDDAVRRLADEIRAAAPDRIVAFRGPDRWVQHHESAPTPSSDDDLIRDGGVYLVTGGSSGLGLELGEHLARTANATTVLVGRTSLPDRSEWDTWLDGHPDNDRTSRLIRRLQSTSDAGGTVEYHSGDVADVDRMSAIVADVVDRHGHLNGVFHAAGALDDGLIAMKAPADADAVLAPKVTGTLALEQAVADTALDFMVLFSSISALTCPPGQVDYAAANAFLDAYAHHRMAIDDRATIAVGWGPWHDVGMTLRTAVELGLVDDEGSVTGVAHSLIDRWYPSPSRDVFELDVSAERQWLLDEHRGADGTAIMPGTGYLDILRAVQAHRSPHSPGVEISDVFFMAPLMLTDGESARLRVEVESDHSFSLSTRHGADHVRGRLRPLDASPPPKVDLDAIRARCSDREVVFDRYDHQHLRWGPRWDNLRSMRYGTDEAFATLQLAEPFVADLDDHPLHPAVLDLATAGAQDLIAGLESDADFFVPFSYGRLRQYAPLTPEVHSSVRSRPASDSETGVFDVVVYAPDGAVLVEIEGFVMRRATGEIAAAAADSDELVERVDPLLESLNNGIRLEEGMEALRRLLTPSARPVVTAVAQDLLALLQQADGPAGDGEGGGTGISHSRPDLSTMYVEPESERELAVAAIWEEMLGVEGIGVHDDFFELGGHSLLLTQAITRIRKLSDAEVSLASLFEASTISQISAELDKAEGDDDATTDGPAAPTLGRVSRDGFRTSVGALHDRDLRGNR